MKGILGKIKSLQFYDTLKHAANYFGAFVFTKLIGLVFNPFLTRVLDPEELGIYNSFMQFVIVGGIIFVLHGDAALVRHKLENDGKDYKSFLGATFIFGGINFVWISIVFYLLLPYLADLMNIPAEALLLYPIIVFYFALNTYFNRFFQARKESKRVSRRNIAFQVSFMGLATLLLLLPYWPKDYRLLIYSQLTVGVGFILFYIFTFWQHTSFKTKKSDYKTIIKFGVPLIPMSLSGMVLNSFDTWMINAHNQAEAGIYSNAYNLGSMLFMVSSALVSAWQPDFLEKTKAGEIKKRNTDALKIIRIVVFAAVGLILVSPDYFQLIDIKYQAGLVITPLVAIGYVVLTYGSLSLQNFIYNQKVVYTAIATTVAATLNIILNYIYIPIHGYQVAAVTTIISFGASTTLLHLFNRLVCKGYYFPTSRYLVVGWVLIPAMALFYYLSYVDWNYWLELSIRYAFIAVSLPLVLWPHLAELWAKAKGMLKK